MEGLAGLFRQVSKRQVFFADPRQRSNAVNNFVAKPATYDLHLVIIMLNALIILLRGCGEGVRESV